MSIGSQKIIHTIGVILMAFGALNVLTLGMCWIPYLITGEPLENNSFFIFYVIFILTSLICGYIIDFKSDPNIWDKEIQKHSHTEPKKEPHNIIGNRFEIMDL
jgi:hypothetical protein